MSERTVYKYPLSPASETTITGTRPKVVHVGIDPKVDDYVPCAWVELDPDGDDTLTVEFIGTGHTVPKGMEHVGSCLTPGGVLVWHVYAKLVSP